MNKERSLDVGCGTYPRIRSDKCTGNFHINTDINIDFLKKLKGPERLDALVAADAKKLPFKNEAFDHIESHHVLEHIPQSREAMKEIARVTKTGGSVKISVPHPVYDTIMAASLLGYYPYWSEENHVNVFSKRKITKIVYDAGINIDNVQQKGWWRAIATIKNYIKARLLNEPISGHSQRLVSERQKKLVSKREEFLQTVENRDKSLPILNHIIPYETVVSGRKI